MPQILQWQGRIRHLASDGMTQELYLVRLRTAVHPYHPNRILQLRLCNREHSRIPAISVVVGLAIVAFLHRFSASNLSEYDQSLCMGGF